MDTYEESCLKVGAHRKRGKLVAGPRHLGFTLIELLMAITIASIITVIAVPIYGNYRERAKIAEAIGLIGPIKIAMIEYYLTNNTWPANNAAVNVPNVLPTTTVQGIAISATPTAGSITITYSTTVFPALVGNESLVFTATASQSIVRWDCTGGTLPQSYRPNNCRS